MGALAWWFPLSAAISALFIINLHSFTFSRSPRVALREEGARRYHHSRSKFNHLNLLFTFLIFRPTSFGWNQNPFATEYSVYPDLADKGRSARCWVACDRNLILLNTCVIFVVFRDIQSAVNKVIPWKGHCLLCPEKRKGEEKEKKKKLSNALQRSIMRQNIMIADIYWFNTNFPLVDSNLQFSLKTDRKSRPRRNYCGPLS